MNFFNGNSYSFLDVAVKMLYINFDTIELYLRFYPCFPINTPLKL